MSAAPCAAPARVPGSIVAAFSAPGLPLAGLVLVFGVYLPRFYVGKGLDFLAVAGAILAVRALDIWLDPFLGLAMDRTRTPIGRYRPWLIAGAPIAMLGVWRLLAPSGPVDTAYLILWLLVAYAGASMLNLGVAAWGASLATTYHERSRLYGWTQGLAVLGAIGLAMLPLVTHGAVVLGKAASMPTVGMILVVAIPLAVLVCALFTPERIAAAGRPRFSPSDYWSAISRPTMWRIIVADLALTLGPGTTAPLYVYFFHDAKGFNIAEVGFLLIFYIAAGLVGAPTWGRLARRIGKPRTIQIACVSYGVAQTVLMVLPRVWPGHRLIDTLPTVAGMFAVGFCASAFLLLIRAMVADVVDEVRLERGQDLTSLLFSMVTTTTKIGTVITLVIAFPILKLVGYNGKEGAVNSAGAIFGLEMCYLFAPIALVFVGGALFFGYRLDARRHAEIRAALEARDEGHAFAAGEESLVGLVAEE
ncbi:MAG TPA: MFS transporter [Caulobacteraceae bacterium]|nr:MFS transporter [Caulobacteraceae bacterium]